MTKKMRAGYFITHMHKHSVTLSARERPHTSRLQALQSLPAEANGMQEYSSFHIFNGTFYARITGDFHNTINTCIFHSDIVINANTCATYTNASTWAQKTSVVVYPAQHTYAMGFAIGNYGYIGTGSNGPSQDDFHQWNSQNNTWISAASTYPSFPSTALASFAVTAGRDGGNYFTIRDNGYFATGGNFAYTMFPASEELWEYNTTSNTWSQRATMTSTHYSRSFGMGFSIGTEGFVGLGFDYAFADYSASDFWKWNGNPLSSSYDTWSQIAAFPGGTRSSGISLKICDKAYMGGGGNVNGFHNDWWEYDATSNTWSQKTSIPYAGGDDVTNVPFFSICCKGYVVTRHGVLLEYDPATDTWTNIGSVPSTLIGTIDGSTGFSINGKGYLIGVGYYFNQLWEWNPSPVVTYPIPSASFTATPTTVCPGQCVTFNANTTGSCNQYNWTFANGSSITNSYSVTPVVCYSVAGTYTASLTLHNCGGWAVTTQTITVCTTPTVTASNSAAGGSICPGSCATLTGTGGGTYSWAPSGQTTSSIVVCPSVTSSYTVTATNACGCTASANTTVIVSSSPTITIASTSTLCPGNPQTLTASGGVSYSWSTGATTTTITVSPTAATCYTVTGTDAGGCTNTAVECVTVDCPDFLYYDCKVYLDIDVFSTYSSITDFGFVIKQWPGTCLSGSPTYSIDYTTMGTFPVNNNNPNTYSFLYLPSGHQAINLTDDFGVVATTASWLPPFAINKDISFELWDCSDPNSLNWSQVPPTDCITTPAAGCAAVVTKTFEPAIQSVPAGFTFGVFPNPASNNITLFYSTPVQAGMFEIYDIYGKHCIKNNLNPDKQSMVINTSLLSNGIYYCRIKIGNDITEVKKIVIAK
jgi:hypothetical protein